MIPRKDEFFEQYGDVLQNIEFAIMQVYAAHPELTDFQADKVLEGLMRGYQAEARGRTAPTLKLTPLEQEMYDAVQAMCDWRLGRATLEPVEPEGELPSDLAAHQKLNTVHDMIACLKRLRSSIKFWTKERGRKGYLDYVKNFFPMG